MQPSEESFLKDVAQHQLTVFHDEGTRRHLRFQQPGTNNMFFDLITWPNFLCYCGDMGTFVFKRVEDMFTFFRGSANGPLKINLSYWAEKCEATDGSDGLKQFSPEKFKAAVKEYLKDAEASREILRAVATEILPYADEGEHEACARVFEFNHAGFCFSDFWEYNLDEYTYRFIWCCYALIWGIRMYDRAKEQNAA